MKQVKKDSFEGRDYLRGYNGLSGIIIDDSFYALEWLNAHNYSVCEQVNDGERVYSIWFNNNHTGVCATVANDVIQYHNANTGEIKTSWI